MLKNKLVSLSRDVKKHSYLCKRKGKNMNFLKKSLLYILVIMLFLLPSAGKVEAATVGDHLTSPETGWVRIDDKDLHIVYNGKWETRTNGEHYNKSIKCTTSLSSLRFKFYGTKFRIISDKNQDHSNNISIKIDGDEYFYSTLNNSYQLQRVVFEKKDLNLGYHTVEISNLKNGKYMNLDAIDLDDTGYLSEYYSNITLSAYAGDTSAILKWNAIEDVTNYTLKRATISGVYDYEKNLSPNEYTVIGSSISFTDTELTNNITYYYVISAVLNGVEISKSDEIAVTPIPKIPTDLSKLKIVLEPEEKLQLSVYNQLDENTNMNWKSSDTTVAEVDVNGVVTAIKAGNAVIHVQSMDGNYSDDINILVVGNAADYRLAVDLKVGKTSRLTVDDLSNTINITWNTSDSTIATVSDKGVVMAKGKGLTLAKAIDTNGNVVGQVYIRVRES